MFSLNIRLTIAIYLIAVFVILYSRPQFIFNKEGKLKSFGVNDKNDNTIFPLWLIFTVIAFISYYIIVYFNF